MAQENSKVRVEINPDGTQNIVSPSGEVLDTIAPGGPVEEKSPAMALLEELQGEVTTPTIRSLTIRGRKYAVRRLCWAGINKFGMLTPRNSKGELNLLSSEDGTDIMAAALLTSVTVSITDPTPFFRNWKEAFAFAGDTSPGAIEINGQVLQAFLNQNPSILPDAKRELVAWDDEDVVEKKDLS